MTRYRGPHEERHRPVARRVQGVLLSSALDHVLDAETVFIHVQRPSERVRRLRLRDAEAGPSLPRSIPRPLRCRHANSVIVCAVYLLCLSACSELY